MLFVDFRSYPLWLNLAIFVVTAGVIWLVGQRLVTYAELIAERTQLGQAFVGLLFLAGATSLPEVGRTIAASSRGNAALAVDSLLGGIALQTAILAVADLVLGRGALTFFAPRPVLLLEGVLLILLLGLALAGITTGELVVLLGIGLWTLLVFGGYLLSLYLLWQYEGRGRWRPVNPPEEERPAQAPADARAQRFQSWSTRRIILVFLGTSAIIFAAGALLAGLGDALTVQTGLGASFVGATLLALATSLPEVTTTMAASRLGAFALAISNIFGSNALLVALLLVADVFYPAGPILDVVGSPAAFSATLGILGTGVYLAGLIERRNVAVFRMGIDSVLVLVLYFAGVATLYALQ